MLLWKHLLSYISIERLQELMDGHETCSPEKKKSTKNTEINLLFEISVER